MPLFTMSANVEERDPTSRKRSHEDFSEQEDSNSVNFHPLSDSESSLASFPVCHHSRCLTDPSYAQKKTTFHLRRPRLPLLLPQRAVLA